MVMLRRKERSKCTSHRSLRGWRKSSKMLHQPTAIDASDLFDGDLSSASLKSAIDAERVLSDDRGQWSNQHGSDGAIDKFRRDDDAGLGFLHFRAASRVEWHEIDVELQCYHVHSFSSDSGSSGASSHSRSSLLNSSPCSASTFLICASHPARGCDWLVERMTTSSFRTRISTSLPSPACSMIDFGKRTPRELPIRTNRAVNVPPLLGDRRAFGVDDILVLMATL